MQKETGLEETIARLREQGYSDLQIISALQQAGYGMAEINAVMKKEVGEMMPSIMEKKEMELPVPTPAPVAAKRKREEVAAMPTAPAAIETEAPEYYYPYAAAAPTAPAAISAETIEEIAEEIVAEKIAELREKMEEITELKKTVEEDISALGERIKRVENTIDRLQLTLLGKVQEYGQSIKDLGTEMQAIESTLGKILSPLIDNIKELGKITEELKRRQKNKK